MSEAVEIRRLREIRELHRSSRGRRGWVSRRFGVEQSETLARGALPVERSNPELISAARAASSGVQNEANPRIFEGGRLEPVEPVSTQRAALRARRAEVMIAKRPDREQESSPLDPAELSERLAWRSDRIPSKAEYLAQRELDDATVERMLPLRICMAEEILRGERDWQAMADWANDLRERLPVGARVIAYGRASKERSSDYPIRAVGAFDVWDVFDLNMSSPSELWDELCETGSPERFELEMLIRAFGGRVKIIRLSNPARIRINESESGVNLREQLREFGHKHKLKTLSEIGPTPLLREIRLADYEWVMANGGSSPPRPPSGPNRAEEIEAIRDALRLRSLGDPRAQGILDRNGGALNAERRLRELTRERDPDAAIDREEL